MSEERINHVSISMQEIDQDGEAVASPATWTINLTNVTADEAEELSMRIFFRLQSLCKRMQAGVNADE